MVNMRGLISFAVAAAGAARVISTQKRNASGATLGNGASDIHTTASRKVKIYTKTGDRGSAMLFNGERRLKDDIVFEALGDTDELNSFTGVARELCEEAGIPLLLQLEEIQSRLLDIGSAIATPLDSSSAFKIERTHFDSSAVDIVERWIDDMEDELPPIRNFILPSGGKASTALHVCRTVCRRAERKVSPLCREKRLEFAVGQYLNRLSDYFFVAARYAALKSGMPETIYKKAAAGNNEKVTNGKSLT